MRVLNVHERELPVSGEVGALLDGLASGEADRLWPWQRWPAMRFDRPLGVGADGGHGPIRYYVEEYETGRRIRFRFTGPKGFLGWHEYRVLDGSERSILQHVLCMRTAGRAHFLWPLLFKPLHDALIEDSLDRAELVIAGRVEQPQRWSIRVRLLRWSLRTGARVARKRRRT